MLEGCTPWPPAVATRYEEEGYWRGEVLGDLLRGPARSTPRRLAVVAGNRSWSYAELDERAERLTAGLAELGIAAGDRVVVQLPNGAEFVTLCVALFRLGALPVFALTPHRTSEIAYLCAHTEAVAYALPAVHQGFDHRELARDALRRCSSLRHVLVAGDPGEFIALDQVDAAPRPLAGPAPREVAFFLLSGGSTGLPKLIPRTHDDYAFQLRATAAALEVDERSVYLAALPAAHNAALGCPGVLGTLRAGGRVVMPSNPSPEEVFPLIEREGVTFTTLMPPHVQLWMESVEWSRVDLSRVLLQIGGAKLVPELARRIKPVLGCRFSHWFGMAEGLLTHTRLDDPEELAVTCCGRPLCDADEVRVVDDDDRPVPHGTVGHLLTRGPYTLRAYYRAEEQNRRSFTEDGFLRTGDLVSVDAAGNINVEGRVKDVINRGGEKVSAAEVEDHLLTHPHVNEVAVVAMPDPLLGERTCAYVVARKEPPTRQLLSAYLRDRGVAAYKCPDRVVLLDALPRTSVGKVDKAALRAAFAEERQSTQGLGHAPAAGRGERP